MRRNVIDLTTLQQEALKLFRSSREARFHESRFYERPGDRFAATAEKLVNHPNVEETKMYVPPWRKERALPSSMVPQARLQKFSLKIKSC